MPVVFESRALARGRLGPAVPPTENLNPAEMFAAHIKFSRARGLQAKLMRVTAAVPGLMKNGLQRDYRNNLY
ncbi:MAG TPA: hypothetical protein VN647_04550 [Nitrospira sp.]|nr:hypothetical protein [Nitrospira sp.]